ncbi:CRISPR-associated protein Cas4 [Thermanaeromonas sp. C210]|uniref:CRISPR-associated protein Cas4 n=1 Tax=Thermanaeromonas sp. C210 TaxID=2731925 RepID=UPI00155BDB51|nr:CRISPR-associated protein Cas4 [Thermanaeromonas sp. C210]GFN22778.1 CRISPR-associated protein Cas4 [Thermanaeromonas sp. C210]
MGWQDAEYIPVSALQHYVFCPRQCALIHLEQVWEENLFTLRGRRVHENVDIPDREVEEGVRIERAVPLWSDRLGLIGRADVVEFLPDGTPYPVEYKAGPRRARRADEVQLCAQGICLEEMTGRSVMRGALYHHGSRRRREVRFTPELRSQVEKVAKAVRQLLQEAALPPPVADGRCRDCSLVDICMPRVLQNLPTWLEREWK